MSLLSGMAEGPAAEAAARPATMACFGRLVGEGGPCHQRQTDLPHQEMGGIIRSQGEGRARHGADGPKLKEAGEEGCFWKLPETNHEGWASP